jgi:HEAT repeat protein
MAVDSLARRRDERAIELLVSALEDDDVDVLYTAAGVLADARMPKATAALIRLALDEAQHVERRAAVILALRWHAGPSEDVRAALDWIAKRADPWLQSLAREMFADRAR